MDLEPNTQSSKTRKVIQKTVVKVKIEANGWKQKNEGAPSDVWSWRKYGQKPIKGSPYPRGYYKCSTSKGCLAKKQVERSKTDASMLLITYTCSHNHPYPDLQNASKVTRKYPKQPEIEPIDELPTPINQEPSEDHFHYLESSSKDLIIDPFTVFHLEDNHELLHELFVFDQDPISDSRLMTFSTATKSEGNDFFDELGELPTSNFSSYMRSSLFVEGIVLQPS